MAGFLNSINLNLLISKVKKLNHIFLKIYILGISWKELPLLRSKRFFLFLWWLRSHITQAINLLHSPKSLPLVLMNPHQIGPSSGLLPSTLFHHISLRLLRSLPSSQAQLPFLVKLLVRSHCPTGVRGFRMWVRRQGWIKWYNEKNHKYFSW